MIPSWCLITLALLGKLKLGMIPGWRFLLPCYNAQSLKSVAAPTGRESETPLVHKGGSQLQGTHKAVR